MIDGFIRATLGPLGVAALDFYIANSLWINGFILLYALLVVLARRTFDRVCQSLVVSLRSQYGRQLDQKKPESLLKTLRRINVPWDQVLRGSAFPFVAPPGSILIYPKGLATLQRLLPPEKLAELLVKP